MNRNIIWNIVFFAGMVIGMIGLRFLWGATQYAFPDDLAFSVMYYSPPLILSLIGVGMAYLGAKKSWQIE